MKTLDVSGVYKTVIYDEYDQLRYQANNFLLDMKYRLDYYLQVLRAEKIKYDKNATLFFVN